MGPGSPHSLLLLLLSWATVVTTAQEGSDLVRVVTFNADGARRKDTWMEYGRPVGVGGDYTLCLRFNIHVFRLHTAIIYLLAVHDFDQFPISFEVYFQKIRTKYGGYTRFYPLPANLVTKKWYHYCHVRDTGSGEGLVYLDGQLLVRENVVFEVDTAIRDVIIGQDEFLNPYSLSGRLSQVNMWGRVLTPDQVLSLARCEVDLEGDVISWSGQWALHNVEQQEVPLAELCGSVSWGRLTVLLPLLRYQHAVQVCRGLQGVITSPANMEEVLQELQYFKGLINEVRWRKPGEELGSPDDENTTSTSILLPLFERCERQWAGVDDQAQEGTWYNPFTLEKKNPSELAFSKHNPDGDKYQNCAVMRQKGLRDTDCKKHSCSACHTSADTTWTLRGICEEEERMYYFDVVAMPLRFRGYGEYMVEQVRGSWVWYNTITNTTMASLSLQHHHHLNYPIGRLTWDLQETVCEQESGRRVLTLSACGPGQFTCTDGSCISFLRRCDLKFDCGDKTDESFCDIVNFPEDYRSRLPPRPVSDLSLPISVNVSIDTLSIDTTTMLLSVSYNLRMTWADNRLTYNNLKALTRLNTVSPEQVEELWRPQVGFINTDDIQHTLVDRDAVTTILRHHPSFVRDLSNPYEVEIYRGDTNPVSTTRKYSTIFTCNFNLVLYPFDIQVCFIHLQVLSASSEYLIFNPNDSYVQYLGQKLLVEYGIGQVDLEVDDTTQYSEMRVRIQLIRRYGYAMLNIYIPSLTLIIISYVTLFFRPSIFEVRVMTALTALLVLATLFTQVSASLPKTSYFKMVDIWLLFCIVLIFLIIIFHTLIDLQVDYGEGASHSTTTARVWGKPPSGGSTVSVIKVSPITTDGGDSVPPGPTGILLKSLRIKFDLQFFITTSKYTMFLIFLVFNVAYWGTLAAGSGLVYYY